MAAGFVGNVRLRRGRHRRGVFPCDSTQLTDADSSGAEWRRAGARVGRNSNSLRRTPTLSPGGCCVPFFSFSLLTSWNPICRRAATRLEAACTPAVFAVLLLGHRGGGRFFSCTTCFSRSDCPLPSELGRRTLALNTAADPSQTTPPPFCPRFFSLAYEPPRGAYVGVKRDDAFLARGDCRSASSKAIRMQSEASAWNALNQAGAGKGPASFGGGCEALRGAARVLIVLCVAYREIRAARLLPARPLLMVPLPIDRLSRTHTRSDTGVGSFFFHTPASHWAFQRAYSSRHQPTRPGSSHGIIRPANKSPRAQPSIETPLR